jgi:hypothetical protein
MPYNKSFNADKAAALPVKPGIVVEIGTPMILCVCIRRGPRAGYAVNRVKTSSQHAEGVSEMRIGYVPGYLVYCKMIGQEVVVLLVQ